MERWARGVLLMHKFFTKPWFRGLVPAPRQPPRRHLSARPLRRAADPLLPSP